MQTDRLHGDVIAGISAYYELEWTQTLPSMQ